MIEITVPALVGLCALAFLMGRAVQNWINGTKEGDRRAYEAGYHDASVGRPSVYQGDLP